MLDAALRDRAAYLRPVDALVVADLHLGRAAASAVDFPLGEGAGLRSRLADLLGRFDPATVVLAGDVLDEFGRVGSEAADGVAALTECCRDAGTEPIAVAGNHDALLGEVWEGPVHDEYRLDSADGTETLVCHGHAEPDGEADRYVIGHDHPAIVIEGRKRPCFLYGPDTFRGGDVLMLPAFTPLAAGTAVNRLRARDFASPLITDADALRPLVSDPDGGAVLSFPPLGRLRRLL